jgi:hypothetical protein
MKPLLFPALALGVWACAQATARREAQSYFPLQQGTGLRPETTASRQIGALKLTLRVAPTPRFTGDTAEVELRAENQGPDSVQFLEQSCYRTFRGKVVVTLPEDTDVCAVGPGLAWLSRGGVYTTIDSVRFVAPGTYRLEMFALMDPEVWMGVPITITKAPQRR